MVKCTRRYWRLISPVPACNLKTIHMQCSNPWIEEHRICGSKYSVATVGVDTIQDHNETPVGLHVRQAALPLGWKQSRPLVYAREGCHPCCTANSNILNKMYKSRYIEKYLFCIVIGFLAEIVSTFQRNKENIEHTGSRCWRIELKYLFLYQKGMFMRQKRCRQLLAPIFGSKIVFLSKNCLFLMQKVRYSEIELC